jgi:ABC-2 type transport system permease protein
MRSALSYLASLVWLNLKSGMRPLWPALFAATLMCANNLIFFVIWLIFFRSFSSLKGWTLADVALLYGLTAWSIGLTVVLAQGVREIGQAIADGSLDVHLGRPRHPLLSLIFSRSAPAGFGDMASSIVLWLTFAGRGPEELPYIIILATAGTAIVVATMTIANSAAFWIPQAAHLVEDVFFMFIMAAVYPQHVLAPFLRFLLFTLLPAGFIGLMPVEAIRDASPGKAAIVFAAALVYGALAALVFERGLRRYTSGSTPVSL